MRVVDVDDPDEEMPSGERGELMFRGPLVMLGYYGNEKATAETIAPDGWLHTGDIATMDEDGYFTIVDRKKDMILTAGFNVYPAEIERVLCMHPAVALAAVGGDRRRGEGRARKGLRHPQARRRRPRARSWSRTAGSTWPRTRFRAPIQFTPGPDHSSGKIMRRLLGEIDDGTRTTTSALHPAAS